MSHAHENYIVRDLIRFVEKHMHSQGKSFWGYMMGIQNVEDLLNFSNLEKGDAERGCRAL